VGPRDDLDGCGKSRPAPRFDPRTFQPVASRYTECVCGVYVVCVCVWCVCVCMCCVWCVYVWCVCVCLCMCVGFVMFGFCNVWVFW